MGAGVTPKRIAEIRAILSDYEKYHEHFCYHTREWVGCCAADCAETPDPPESRERTAIADLLAEVERLTAKPAKVARWSPVSRSGVHALRDYSGLVVARYEPWPSSIDSPRWWAGGRVYASAAQARDAVEAAVTRDGWKVTQ